MAGTFVTMDGVMQAPGGPGEDRDGGFEHGGWLVPYLLQTLLRANLVDTLRIWQFPVVLGTGKPLFGDGTSPAGFSLVHFQTASTGALLHVYERAGRPRYGGVEVGRDMVIFE